jgi:hypothetical protein
MKSWLGSSWCFTEAVTVTFLGKDVVASRPRPGLGPALDPLCRRHKASSFLMSNARVPPGCWVT